VAALSFDKLLILARAAMQDRQYSIAVNHYRKALELCKETIDTRLELADGYLHLDDRESAIAILNDIPGQILLNYENHYKIAQLFHRSHDHKSALDHYRQALEYKPGNRSILASMALQYIKLKEHNDAKNILNKLRDRYPDWDRPYDYLSQICKAEGKLNEAFDYLATALSIQNGNVQLAMRMASLLRDMDRLDEAIDAYSALLAKSSDLHRVSILIALADVHLVRKDWGLANNCLTMALSYDIHNADAYIKLIDIAVQRCDAHEVIAQAKIALNRIPGEPHITYKLAIGLLSLGYYQDAVNCVHSIDFDKVIEALAYSIAHLFVQAELLESASAVLMAAKFRSEADRLTALNNVESSSLTLHINKKNIGIRNHPLRVYWWRHSRQEIKNFGDELNPIIIERISGKKVIWSPLEECEIVAIGSILQQVFRSCRMYPVDVWGSGFLSSGESVHDPRLVCHSLRGPLTAARIDCDQSVALGDPGLLCNLLLERNPQKTTALGIVPHYYDLRHPLLEEYSQDRKYKIISPLLPVCEFISAVAECEVILSSALHGLITADALGIPNRWLKLSDLVVGDGFKFNDYFMSFGLNAVRHDELPHASVLTTKKIMSIADNYNRNQLDVIREGLLRSIPF